MELTMPMIRNRQREQPWNTYKKQRGSPQSNTSGKRWDATLGIGRRARQQHAFPDRKHKEAASHNVISGTKVFYCKQRGRHHQPGTVDRP